MSESSSESDDDVSLEESLLLCARREQINILCDILQRRQAGTMHVDINCKGCQKSNRGWTGLHLAAYFGHTDTLRTLLKFGANVNEVNNTGDTALHKAAHTDRLEVVTVLLQNGADVSMLNAEGHTAKSLTTNQAIIKLIEAAEVHETSRVEEEFMSSVRRGEVEKIKDLVSSGKVNSVGCLDSFGNSALHIAAQSGQKDVAVFLLQQGIDVNAQNNQGQLACDVAKNEQMRQKLQVKPWKQAVKVPARFEGFLIKKKFVGSTPVWVVLERGVLSYFKNRGDATTGAKRRGMEYLDNADLQIFELNNIDFLIKFSDGTIHKLCVDPGASEVRLGRDPVTGEVISRQMWINALKEHVAYNTHYMDTGNMKHSSSTNQVPLISVQESLKVAKAQQDVLEHQVKQLTEHMNNSQGYNHQCKCSKLRGEIEKTVRYSKEVYQTMSQCIASFAQQQEVQERVAQRIRDEQNSRGIYTCLSNGTS